MINEIELYEYLKKNLRIQVKEDDRQEHCKSFEIQLKIKNPITNEFEIIDDEKRLFFNDAIDRTIIIYD